MSGILSDNVGRSSGLIKAVEAGGGAFVHLITQDFTSAISNFSWDSTYITTTYDTYLIVWQMRSATQVSADMRVSSDDGSSWSTGYSDGFVVGAGGVGNENNDTRTYMKISEAAGNETNEYSQGQIWLCNPMSSAYQTTIFANSMVVNASGLRQVTMHSGLNNTLAQDNAVLFGSGGFTANLEEGKYSLYGVKRS
jgi:hypothetical protein